MLNEKSAQFQKAFAAAGFVFPVELIGGNPNTLKPYDEGYYLVDAKGDFFRLRQVRGTPELLHRSGCAGGKAAMGATSAALPSRAGAGQPRNPSAHRGRDNGVHLVVGKEFRLVTLPVEHFDPAQMAFTLRGDLLNRLLVVSSPEYVEAVAMNRNYELVDRYTETLPAKAERSAGRIAASVFPFTLELESATSGFLDFHFVRGDGIAWGLNLALLAAVVAWWIFRQRPLRPRWPELAAVGFGGIFGFALIWLLPKTD